MDITGTTASGIAASVRDLVSTGRARGGDALPPIRTLAQELGVNRNTVAAAYRLLVAAGVAETRGRGGTAIASVPDVAREGSAGLRRELVDLASGNPDPRLLPNVAEFVSGYEPPLYGAPPEHEGLAAWAHDHFARELAAGGPSDVVRRADADRAGGRDEAARRAAADRGATGGRDDGSRRGDADRGATGGRDDGSRRGDADRGGPAAAGRRDDPADRGADFGVVVTHGAVDAIERLLAAHLTRGDAVAVEDPCFLGHISTLRLNGFDAVPVPVDATGMVPDGLERALAAGARAVICTPRAQNPTGASLTAGRADALRAVLARHPHVLVIEDDHFWALSTAPYHRVTPPDMPRWALVRSVAKFLGPDLRVAIVATDHESADRLHARLGPATTWVSHLLQHAVARMLVDPEIERLRERARAAYAERAALLGTLATDGLNVWIATPVTAEALATRGWRVRPAAAFAVGEPAAAVRVTTSALTAAQAAAFTRDLQEIACSPD